MSDLGDRLRRVDGLAIGLVLIVGYVYVQLLRAVVNGPVMPFLARDLSGDPSGFAGDSPLGHLFRLGDRLFFYGDVLSWGLALALLLITLVVLDRRLAWRR